MSQTDVTKLAQQGSPKAIASLLASQLGSKVKVQAGLKQDTCVVRITSSTPLEQRETVSVVEAFFTQLQCSEVKQCIVQFVVQGDAKPLWNQTFDISIEPVEAELAEVKLASEEQVLAEQPMPAEVVAAGLSQETGNGKWKFPGMNLGNLQKLGGQMTEQAAKAAQETAMTAQDSTFKVTEQAMRASINQTMNAFQIAVDEIQARKLPAEKTALTGTINVGIIQLSIRLDIPMDQETGEIAMDIQ